MIKRYYQQRYEGWTLDPLIYTKTTKLIQRYRLFEEILASPRHKSDERERARHYLQIIDLALDLYVPEPYQAAVLSHLADKTPYTALEKQHFLSTSTMKRYVQILVWGVAEELSKDPHPPFDPT